MTPTSEQSVVAEPAEPQCNHIWGKIETVTLSHSRSSSYGCPESREFCYVQTCEKCGKTVRVV